MTIIAAMRESEESLLIGADSGSTTLSGFRQLVDDKLHRHPDRMIAWGIAGSPYLGINLFTKRLQDTRPAPDNWENLTNLARTLLVEICDNELKFSEPFHSKNTVLLSVLIVGWLADKPGMLMLCCGHPPDLAEYGLTAIGQETISMDFGYKLLEKSAMSNVDKFLLLLNTGAVSFDACSPPVHVWRIKKDSIQIVESP